MKRTSVRIISLILLFALVLSFSAYAAVDAYTDTEREELWARFDKDGIEAVLEDFCADRLLTEKNFAVYYKNTVTGEEIFWNEDTWFVSGGIYTIPLNMLYTDKLADGEVNADTKLSGVSYDEVRDGSIINFASNNNDILRNSLGGYEKSRHLLLKYLDVDESELPERFYSYNWYSASMMMDFMDILYTDREKYAGIIDAMKRTEAKTYFNTFDCGCEIAHKPGAYDNCTSDVAIVYADEPFLLVECSQLLPAPQDTEGAVLRLFAEYNRYTMERDAKKAAEEEAARIAAEEEAARVAAEEEAARVAAEEEAARVAAEEEAAHVAAEEEAARVAAEEEAARVAAENSAREELIRQTELRRRALQGLCILEFALVLVTLVIIVVRNRRDSEDYEDEDDDYYDDEDE